jgi:hypothetical protein
MCEPDRSADDVFAANGWLRLELLEPPAAKAATRAACWAIDTRWDSLRTPHLFMGLLSSGDRFVTDWCRLIGADPDGLLMQFAAMFTCPKPAAAPLVRLNREFISENAIRALRATRARSLRQGREQARTSDLLVSVVAPEGGIVAGCFAGAGLAPDRLAALALAAEGRQAGPNGR